MRVGAGTCPLKPGAKLAALGIVGVLTAAPVLNVAHSPRTTPPAKASEAAAAPAGTTAAASNSGEEMQLRKTADAAFKALRDTDPLLEGIPHAITWLHQRAGLKLGALTIGPSPSAISQRVTPTPAECLDGKPALHCLLHGDLGLWRSLCLLELARRRKSDVAMSFVATPEHRIL